MSNVSSVSVQNIKVQISKIEKLVYEHIKRNNQAIKEVRDD